MDAGYPAADSGRCRSTRPGPDDPSPVRRLGMVLSTRLEEGRFGLDVADIDSFVSRLDMRLHAPARRWVVLYVAWLLREALGSRAVKSVWFQVVATLDRALQSPVSECALEGIESDDADAWLARLDRWLAQDVEDVWDALPVEVHAAGMLIALDARGLDSAGVHLIDEEFAVAALLIEIRLRTKDWIDEAVCVALGKAY
mgnify:FL=1